MKTLMASLSFNFALACIAQELTLLTPHSPDPALETLLIYITFLPLNLWFLLLPNKGDLND